MFDRTIDVATNRFEFFVAPASEHIFLEVMAYFEREGTVRELVALPNRLIDVSVPV